MNKEEQKELPFGVILSTTFLILVGTWIFSRISYMSFEHTGELILVALLALFGTLFIILGWGILTLKSWAFYLTVIVSIVSFIYGFTLIVIFGPLFLILLILFLLIVAILFRYKQLYQKTVNIQQNNIYTRGRLCTNCGRPIPFDALLCPYCGKKFKSFL
jgi:hypothetical protein